MPLYAYQATDRDGKTSRGEIDADTLADAIAKLESRGLTAESVTLASPPQTAAAPAPDALPDSTHLPADNTRWLADSTLDEHFAGIFQRREGLIPALRALASELPDGTARREIHQLARALERARSSADLRASKQAVRWLPLLATGLTEQPSAQRLGELVALAARESRNRSERRRLLAYPLIVLLISFGVFALFCAIVVPSFANMFKEFGLLLPASTRFVIYVSDQFQDHFLETTITVAVAALVIYVLLRLWVQFALTTRLLGPLSTGNSSSVSAMSSLIGQLAELLNIGISLPDALWIAGQGCRHFHFKRVAEKLAQHAYDSSKPLSECHAATKVPANLIYALQAGAEGGPNIPLLRELSALYGNRATQRVDWLTGAIAQFSIVIIGFAVGFLVIALFAPLVSLITGLS